MTIWRSYSFFSMVLNLVHSRADHVKYRVLIRASTLVFLQRYNYGFSVPVLFRSKALCAGKGHSLVKHCNAAAGQHRVALRVSLSTSTDCVVPLDKDVAKAGPASEASALGLACEARLAVNVDRLTELAIITLKEH